MILVGEFSGWYQYTGGTYVRSEEWGYVYAFNGPWAIVLVPVGAAMLYVAYLSYNATKETPTLEEIERMYQISRAILIGILAGTVLFIMLVIENDDWWLSEGFYGGAIGSFVSTILLNNAKNKF